jgi:hypothetical protein
MRHRDRWFVSLLAGLLLFGAAGPAASARAQERFRYAYAHADCAPWDGAALTIVLQDAPAVPAPGQGLPAPRYPRYAITLWTGAPPLGRWIALPGEGPKQANGSLTESQAADRHAQRSGRVILHRRTGDRLEGELRVRLGESDPRERVFPFSAPLLRYQALCG